MPRIRQLAEKYAEDDQKKVEKAFWKSVKVRCAEQDIDTWADLGQQTGIPESTFQNYRANIGKIQINTMRKMVGLLKPDIQIVLLLLGYSEKDIQRFAQALTN